MTTTTTTLNGTGSEAVQIPVLGLGTWPMTGQECTDAVLQALEVGYRHVDTAENYGNDDAVGAAVLRSGLPREEVFVTSKFNRQWHGGVERVREGLEANLERMGLDFLDLYLVHWPNPDQDRFVESCEALAELTRSGLIRAWGVSNFLPEHLERVARAGVVPSLNQIHCEPTDSQRAVREANAAAGAVTAAYSPLGRGGDLLQIPELVEIAERLDRTPGQVVLRWHVQQGRVAVPKSADRRRQAENLDVFSFELTEADLAVLDGLDVGRTAPSHKDPREFGH